MPVAIALIFGVVVLAVCLVGLLWTLAILTPFYVYVGLAVYWVWRNRRREAELAASVEREADKQRQFNEQEMRAWRSSLDGDRGNASKRDRTLRDFDKSREPPYR